METGTELWGPEEQSPWVRASPALHVLCADSHTGEPVGKKSVKLQGMTVDDKLASLNCYTNIYILVNITLSLAIWHPQS